MAKVEAARGYGATVELAGEGFDETVAVARTREAETGATFVHAFEDARVVAGQGTLGLELAGPAAVRRADGRDPGRRRRARGGNRDRAPRAAPRGADRRRPVGSLRAVRGAGAGGRHDRRRHRRQASRHAHPPDPRRADRRGRRRRRRGDLAGDRAAARAVEARRRGRRRRSGGGRPRRPGRRRRPGVRAPRGREHRRDDDELGDPLRDDGIRAVPRRRPADPGPARRARATSSG